jgi:aldehyde:ferredoxin oxidoreductase
VSELPKEPQYPAQGRTLFVDVETRGVQSRYTPRRILETLLSGRGANMFYLYRLLDESLYPLHPDIPLIFGSGVLTGIVPSAARGNCTSWAPESGVILDSNCGDYFPSFLRMNGIESSRALRPCPAVDPDGDREGEIEWRDAAPYVGSTTSTCEIASLAISAACGHATCRWRTSREPVRTAC